MYGKEAMKTRNRYVSISRFLAFVLRHHPEHVGLTLDPHGWVPVVELLESLRIHGHALDHSDLLHVLILPGKRRFALSEDGERIRALHGHSIRVRSPRPPDRPPAVLFHGTTQHTVDAIRREGILRMGRTFVHLSNTVAAAREVGSRRGRAAVLTVCAGSMAHDGYTFFNSTPGIWLVDHVPAYYVELE